MIFNHKLMVIYLSRHHVQLKSLIIKYALQVIVVNNKLLIINY